MMGANQHDKWSPHDLILAIVARRPTSQQHLCADEGYDYTDVHQVFRDEHYVPHNKHRCRRAKPLIEECPIPGEVCYPTRRWVG